MAEAYYIKAAVPKKGDSTLSRDEFRKQYEQGSEKLGLSPENVDTAYRSYLGDGAGASTQTPSPAPAAAAPTGAAGGAIAGLAGAPTISTAPLQGLTGATPTISAGAPALEGGGEFSPLAQESMGSTLLRQHLGNRLYPQESLVLAGLRRVY